MSLTSTLSSILVLGVGLRYESLHFPSFDLNISRSRQQSKPSLVSGRRCPLNLISTLTASARRTSPIVMAPQAEPQTQPDILLPPLLALPLELKLKILSNFSDYASESSDPDHALALMMLRRTHRSFRQIIPSPWKKIRPRADHLLAAKRKHKYLFTLRCWCPHPGHHCNDYTGSDYLPCYECLELRECRGNFRNYHVASHGDYELGAEHAGKRICDKCWKYRLVEWTSQPNSDDDWY